MSKRIVFGAGVGLLACLGVASVVSDQKGVAFKVFGEDVSTHDIARSIKAAGVVDARVKVQVSAPVVGRIQKLYVEEGDSVREGDPIIDLDKESLRAVRDGVRAQVQVARLLRDQAEVDRQEAESRSRRLRSLSVESIVPEEQVEVAGLRYKSSQIACEAARERLRQAEAELKKVEDDLAKSTVFSPLTGSVIRLTARAGEVVVSGTQNNPASIIATLADLSDLIVDAAVDESEISDVRVGQPARVEAEAVNSRTYEGHVVEIGATGTSLPTRPDLTVFRVRIGLELPDPALRPGMSVKVSISTASVKRALAVPIQAVLERERHDESARPSGSRPTGPGSSERVVFVVRDGRAVERAVEVGLSDATSIQVVSGLSAGEKIVVGPYRILKNLVDGDRLQLVSPDDTKPSKATIKDRT